MDPVELIKNSAILLALLVACTGYYKAEMSKSTIELLRGERDALDFKVKMQDEEIKKIKEANEKQAGKIEILENLLLRRGDSVRPTD